MPELSVVIPAYKEAARLPPSVEKVLEYLRASGRSHELLVVDDGSKDSTVATIEAMNRDGAGIRLQGLTIEKPSLDDVFLRVTGEALEHEVGTEEDESAASPVAEVAS